jgi:hypothetical protein
MFVLLLPTYRETKRKNTKLQSHSPLTLTSRPSFGKTCKARTIRSQVQQSNYPTAFAINPYFLVFFRAG